jgi:hypothetical protein
MWKLKLPGTRSMKCDRELLVATSGRGVECRKGYPTLRVIQNGPQCMVDVNAAAVHQQCLLAFLREWLLCRQHESCLNSRCFIVGCDPPLPFQLRPDFTRKQTQEDRTQSEGNRSRCGPRSPDLSSGLVQRQRQQRRHMALGGCLRGIGDRKQRCQALMI